MPEGHTVHRTANEFNTRFAGNRVTVDSPQGRFAPGAERVSGQELSSASAVGKQLFLEFESRLTVRIHLGIYGKWRWSTGAAVAKKLLEEPVGEVRARFYTGSALTELRGPTVCEVISRDEVLAIQERLGPDPLNPDPLGQERERFVARVRRSGQSIAQLLMDQSVISGIGNVYRAELLFRAGLDPYAVGKALPAEIVGQIWDDSVRLLEVGVKHGVMITRDELLAKDPGKAERNFVYKREGEPCRVCGKKVSIALLNGRKLYWCPKCQR
jgi:DNA-formamidopyrimidine glycosylase